MWNLPTLWTIGEREVRKEALESVECCCREGHTADKFKVFPGKNWFLKRYSGGFGNYTMTYVDEGVMHNL